jgi:hypothetical protein
MGPLLGHAGRLQQAREGLEPHGSPLQSKLRELRAEKLEAERLVDAMREQVTESNELIDGWIEVFDLRQGGPRGHS